MFTFMMAPFSAGLVIYWAWSNTLSICQQYFIMRRHGAPIGKKAAAAAAGATPAVTTGPEKKPKKGPSKKG
jgi:YidC/Oxa1 family membrane protein insertase